MFEHVVRGTRRVSTFGAAIALIAALTAPAAGAITRQVALVIKTHAPSGSAGQRFSIDWKTESGDTKSSGTQRFNTSSDDHTSSQRFALHFEFTTLTKYGDPFHDKSFKGFIFNPLVTRPEVKLTGVGRTFFTDKDGYSEGQSRTASIDLGPGDLHFKVKRESDSSGHKNFTLWIWITDGG